MTVSPAGTVTATVVSTSAVKVTGMTSVTVKALVTEMVLVFVSVITAVDPEMMVVYVVTGLVTVSKTSVVSYSVVTEVV